jgi:RNA polymerase sigma-70 factor (ECF subfamily)
MGLNDQELVQRWQRGEVAAFEALVRRWERPIARFLTHVVGQQDLVPDLCQEVFLRLYLSGWRYRGESAFSTWLYQVALNIARDAGRKRRRDAVPLVDHDPPSRGPTAEASCEHQELAGAVQQALRRLPSELREVLVLRHYEGLSFEAMARITGAPASTLKSRFAVALSRMRQHLQPFVGKEVES